MEEIAVLLQACRHRILNHVFMRALLQQEMILYRVFAYIKEATKKKFATSAEYELKANVDEEQMLDNVQLVYIILA